MDLPVLVEKLSRESNALENVVYSGNFLPPQLRDLEPGSNLLVDIGDRLYLMKYESSSIEMSSALEARLSRHLRIGFLGDVMPTYLEDKNPELMAKWKEKKDNHPLTHKNPAKRIQNNLQLNLFGTEVICFEESSKSDIYWVSANENKLFGDVSGDVMILLANQYADGRIDLQVPKVEFLVGTPEDSAEIEQKLMSMVRPNHYESSILPFLESRTSGLRQPTKGLWGRVSASLSDRSLPSEGFVYVGNREEVHVFRSEEGEEGGENRNSISFVNESFAASKGSQNAYKHLVPRLKPPKKESAFSEPFVFTAIKKDQHDRTNVPFGRPKVITANPEEALRHFSTTSFAEYEDLVREYIFANQAHLNF